MENVVLVEMRVLLAALIILLIVGNLADAHDFHLPPDRAIEMINRLKSA